MKNNKSNTSIIQTQSNTKNEKIKGNENNEKNNIKGGSVLENNHQDEKTKFITLARKMVDND